MWFENDNDIKSILVVFNFIDFTQFSYKMQFFIELLSYSNLHATINFEKLNIIKSSILSENPNCYELKKSKGKGPRVSARTDVSLL